MCMVKIYDESLVKPPVNIFQFSLETENFLEERQYSSEA